MQHRVLPRYEVYVALYSVQPAERAVHRCLAVSSPNRRVPRAGSLRHCRRVAAGSSGVWNEAQRFDSQYLGPCGRELKASSDGDSSEAAQRKVGGGGVITRDRHHAGAQPAFLQAIVKQCSLAALELRRADNSRRVWKGTWQLQLSAVPSDGTALSFDAAWSAVDGGGQPLCCLARVFGNEL